MTSNIARGRLTDLAYWHVRNGILRGDLRPGTVLAESELARTIGGSRTPVRQALGRLLQEGLIEVGPRRQSIVRGFTPDHRQEMLLLRGSARGCRGPARVRGHGHRGHRPATAPDHPPAARGRRGPQRRLPRSRRAVPPEDRRRSAPADSSAFLGQLRGFVRVATLGATRPPRVLDEVVTEHERIVDAIEARDPDAAIRGARGSPRSERLRRLAERRRDRETVSR